MKKNVKYIAIPKEKGKDILTFESEQDSLQHLQIFHYRFQYVLNRGLPICIGVDEYFIDEDIYQ